MDYPKYIVNQKEESISIQKVNPQETFFYLMTNNNVHILKMVRAARSGSTLFADGNMIRYIKPYLFVKKSD